MTTTNKTTANKRTKWDDKKIQRLSMWLERYKGKKDIYTRVAKHFSGTSSHAIYKIANRKGLVGKKEAPWSKRERELSGKTRKSSKK